MKLPYLAAMLAGTAALCLLMNHSPDAREITAIMNAAYVRVGGNGVPDHFKKRYPICRAGVSHAR